MYAIPWVNLAGSDRLAIEVLEAITHSGQYGLWMLICAFEPNTPTAGMGRCTQIVGYEWNQRCGGQLEMQGPCLCDRNLTL